MVWRTCPSDRERSVRVQRPLTVTVVSKEPLSDVLRVVLLRYGFGLAASAVCWMLPLPAGIRQVLALSLLAPVPSVSLAYCERCGCDSGAVGAIHSLCIPISLAFTLLVCLM